MKSSEQALAAHLDLSARQEELYPILERQARLYTMGETSSLPLESMRELLHSIRFCIETHTMQWGLSAQNTPLLELFEAGQRDVWQFTEQARRLHAHVRRYDPNYGSIACRDTTAEIGDFFRHYDLRFFAHDIPCMIDYPLCLPVPESLEGVRFIGEYLRRLLLEHRFCGCFARDTAVRMLSRFQPEYRELVLGLFEPVFTCAVGLSLLKKDATSLYLSAADCERLHNLFQPWTADAAPALLKEAVNRLCIQFRLWDTSMREYLLQAAAGLPPLLLNATRAGYYNLFSADH